MFVLMCVAAFKVHLVNGFFWNKGGYEYPLMWACLCIAIFIRGGGRLSLDAKIGREFCACAAKHAKIVREHTIDRKNNRMSCLDPSHCAGSFSGNRYRILN